MPVDLRTKGRWPTRMQWPAWLRWPRHPIWRLLARGLVAITLLLSLALLLLRCLPHAPLRDRVACSRAVTARDGTVLRLTLAPDGQYRIWTPLERISPAMLQATLLYEDRRFYIHPGINPWALVRAAISTYARAGRRIGGSTITMQLARRLWDIPSRNIGGKVIQIFRALELEALYSKRDIIEAYLNIAPYGGNIEGVGAAAEIYFRKRASALTLAEALTLAVIPQSPARRATADFGSVDVAETTPGLSPLDRARRALLAERAHAPASWRIMTEPPVRLWPALRRPDDLPFLAPHFVEMVLAESTSSAPSLDDTLATTLDLHLQRLAERHLQSYVARHRARGLRNAAALLVDTRTVAIRAMVGSANFFDSTIAGQVNGTLAHRSPGSTLKPLVYALGMDQGIIHPATMLRDVPTAFAAYSPENFDGRFVGPLSAKDALIRSRNVPALEISSHLARPNLYQLLTSAGVSLPFPESHYGLGLTLGTGEVTMEDLARLYAALANGGVMRSLTWSAKAESARGTGQGASTAKATRRRVGIEESDAADARVPLVSPEAAYLVLDMLRDNPRPHTPTRATTAAISFPVAWKTGTSWGFRDAWSVGVFGPYVLGVWVGDFSGEGNPAFVGAEAAAPLFFELADSIAAQDPALLAKSPLPLPPAQLRHVQVCAVSGGLPTADCPHRRETWFIPGRSPIQPCALHRTYALDSAGRRTCSHGPAVARTERFEVWPSDLAKLFAAAGLPRRPAPPVAPGCESADEAAGTAPRITSPLAGVTYSLKIATETRANLEQTGVTGDDTLALQAVTDGDAAEVFWFADQQFLGKAKRGSTLFWRPSSPGAYTVRVVDDHGRSDARAVGVELRR